MLILGFIIFILGFISFGFIILIPWGCEKKFLNMEINHDQQWNTLIKHGQHWSNNHGPTRHYHKDCLNMKINHGQPWFNVTF